MKARAAIGACVLAISLSGCGLDVLYADWKVDGLCKEDGGITVYVRDVLPAELKSATGEIDFRALERSTDRDPYYLLTESRAMEARDPVIRRFEFRLMRQRDGQTLGKAVLYMRPTQNVGVPVFHQKAHVCPSDNVAGKLAAAVFSNEAK